jgi:hypothetical protein
MCANTSPNITPGSPLSWWRSARSTATSTNSSLTGCANRRKPEPSSACSSPTAEDHETPPAPRLVPSPCLLSFLGIDAAPSVTAPKEDAHQRARVDHPPAESYGRPVASKGNLLRCCKVGRVRKHPSDRMIIDLVAEQSRTRARSQGPTRSPQETAKRGLVRAALIGSLERWQPRASRQSTLMPVYWRTLVMP